MKLLKKAGSTSEIWQLFLADSSSTTGAGLTGVVAASLTGFYHRDVDTAAVTIALATMTVGTFTSGGFAQIDATNMPGWYQFCPPNAALTGGKSVAIHIKGATNLAPLPIEVQLSAVDPDSATAFITGVNSIAPPSNWNLMSIDASGRVDLIKVAGTTQTARDLGASVLLSAGTGTGQLDFTSGVVKANLAQILGTAFTETAGQIAAAFKQFFNIASPTSTMNRVTLVDTATTVTNQLTAAQVATGVWQDATAGDFTTASSIGKSLYTTGNAPGAASGLALVGSNVGAATSVSGAVGSVTSGVTVTTNNDKTGYALSAAGVQAVWDALTSALTTVGSIGKLLVTNIDALISSRGTSTYTGTDTSGTTTLLSRLTATRAGNLDYLDQAISAASTLTTAERNAIADALLGRNLAGGSSTGRTVTSALRKLRNKVAVSGGTLTVYQEDDTAVDHTEDVVTAAGNPIVSTDPTT